MASRVFSVEDGNLSGQTTIKTTQNREYIDLDLAFTAKGSGDIYKKTSAASVKQALKLLLMTNRTEKPFSPYFGANLQELLFELADEQTANEINFAIRENIRVFEPRIDPDTLDISSRLAPDNNTITITIIFNIVNSNETVEFTTRLNRLR
jgi:phage baseplate assembly protein W